MPDVQTPLPPTGFDWIDNNAGGSKALHRAPRSIQGLPMVQNPMGDLPKTPRARLLEGSGKQNFNFERLDEAYRVDSYVRQGIDKYVELLLREGWIYDCETPEPVLYLKRRFLLMGIMTRKPWEILVSEIVTDFCKYGNAFLVKKRGKLKQEVPGIPPTGAGGEQLPILGYFRADPKRMKKRFSADGKKWLGWEYTASDGKNYNFRLADVIHFPYNVQAGDDLGSPTVQPVLEDVKAYRQCEEYVIRLLYKHLNPLLHHEVPALKDLDYGRQEDVDAAAAMHTIVAPDGMVVTPPGHKINIVGAESRALRGEGYMALLKQRVFTGLGVSQVAMGEGDSTAAGSADAQTASMHNKAKYYHFGLAAMLTHFVLFELLMEGGFDPVNPQDVVQWIWRDFEVETQIKRENNEIQKWINNGTDHDEFRRALGLKPMTEEQVQRTFTFLFAVPEGEAMQQAKADAAGAVAAVKAKNSPSNQHGTRSGPKVRPR